MAQFENSQLFDARDTNPTISADGSGLVTGRGTKRGEQVVQTVNDDFVAVEGNYGILSNPTPGTAITSQASITAYDGTKDVLHIMNSETSKALVIRYIKMFVSVVP